MTSTAVAADIVTRLRDAELRETALAIAVIHAEEAGSQVISLKAIRHIFPSLDAPSSITYEVVTCQIVGSPHNWSYDYQNPLAIQFQDRREAIAVGKQELTHDDFCIATYYNGKLFAYGPSMTDWHPSDRDSLTEIAKHLCVKVHPLAVDGGREPETQLQPDGTYEPVERTTGTAMCPADCGLPLGHESECYL